jgi:hypothetical protein
VIKHHTALNRALFLITTMVAVISLGGPSAHADASTTFTQADLKAWVLNAMADMRATEPGPEVSWADTYDITAAKIAEASSANPLLGDPLHTAATMVVMGWYESRYRPDAVGDHGTSYGMWQAKTSTVREVGCSKEDLFDPNKAAECTLKLLHVSFSACSRHPINERLAQYAYGLDCDHRLGLSRSRMSVVARLMKKLPLVHVESVDDPPENTVVLSGAVSSVDAVSIQ